MEGGWGVEVCYKMFHYFVKRLTISLKFGLKKLECEKTRKRFAKQQPVSLAVLFHETERTV
jgi:hypothetical protein